MLISGVVLLHDNALPRTAARTRALLEHFDWELFDHPPYSPDLAPSDYHQFIYLNNWSESQRFNSNEELMEGVKTWLCSQVAECFCTGTQHLFPDTTNASFPTVTTLRSSLSVYLVFVYNTIFYLIACFVKSSPEVTFRIVLVLRTSYLA
jgi:hypothetical protein